MYLHTGKLPSNKRRHPFTWTFISNKQSFYVSVHTITEEIDMGNLFSETCTYRDINDTSIKINNKIIHAIEGDLLERAISNYQQNKIQVLTTGRYDPSVARNL